MKRNIRPGQWLGLLKILVGQGAEFSIQDISTIIHVIFVGQHTIQTVH